MDTITVIDAKRLHNADVKPGMILHVLPDFPRWETWVADNTGFVERTPEAKEYLVVEDTWVEHKIAKTAFDRIMEKYKGINVADLLGNTTTAGDLINLQVLKAIMPKPAQTFRIGCSHDKQAIDRFSGNCVICHNLGR